MNKYENVNEWTKMKFLKKKHYFLGKMKKKEK